MSDKTLKQEALALLLSAFNGFTQEEWCQALQEKSPGHDPDDVKKIIKDLVENHWQVQLIKEGGIARYTHLDLLL